ncbi:hypothetical protein SAMN05192561_10596 [Halopenitus malekzadehii]|uniref:DUF429 domain-containing protein n=1 Tax=Halopenitus malekzadehii TaxID=1267564 RepID=A0A1H6J4L8_9EURY|nr:hypothetical protein [Halopenitus malekzadehii]SEH53770.1 hypothetical protein SAMN05192561_10596 [Halopenitus malekzadehii]
MTNCSIPENLSVLLGVDWAGDHWLCLEHRPNSAAPHPATYDSIKDVWEDYDDGHDIDRLCIDIPIRLPTGPNERAVDNFFIKYRQLLNSRAVYKELIAVCGK